MKKIFIALAVAMLIGTPAKAEEVRRTLDAAAESEVRVVNVSGEIEVEGWDRKEVEVVADLGSGVKELIFERHGDEIIIEVKLERHKGRHSGGTDLTIKVPKGSSLDVNAVSSDITVRNVRGRQRLNSVSGDIETRVFGSDTKAESVSGDVSVRGDGSTLRVRATTVSGDIEIENIVGELNAEAVSGEISVVTSELKSVDLQTVNGEISFDSELMDGARMDVETVNGEAIILLAGSVSGRFDIETFNGRIKNCFGPKAERVSKYAPGYELSFNEGNGKGRVSIRTLNGGVELCKR